MNKNKNAIHKGHHYHNDCEHSNDEYAFSMEIRLGNGNKLPFDVYLLNGKSFNESQQMCMRMGSSGNYISTNLYDVVKSYLKNKCHDWNH